MTARCTIWVSVVGVLILVLVIVTYLLGTWKITPHMLTDSGYFRWAHGMAPFQPKYRSAFEHDYRLQQRFVGQSIESLRPLFPKLHSGAGYDPDSYRAKNVREFFSQSSGTRTEVYWLDGTQQEFGFGVLVKDGKIREFFPMKG
jgi:hypothetical protein